MGQLFTRSYLWLNEAVRTSRRLSGVESQIPLDIIMGHYINFYSRNTKNGEVISERQLCVAQDVVDFLRENVREEGIFRFTGQTHIRRKILATLLRGDRVALRQQLKREMAIEIAAAFQTYLQCFKIPLIPTRVQELLIADNPGVPEEVIAEDALGLLHQDLSGRHLHLIKSLLELLNAISHSTHRSELSSLNLPIALLPTFFNVKQPWNRRWQQVAAIFNEIIMRAPDWPGQRQKFSHGLRTSSAHSGSSRLDIFEPRQTQLEPIRVA